MFTQTDLTPNPMDILPDRYSFSQRFFKLVMGKVRMERVEIIHKLQNARQHVIRSQLIFKLV